MVFGIGIDLVEVDRFRAVILRRGERFLKRVFTQGEMDHCLAKRVGEHVHLAARFAAKEALFKALGSGWGEGVSWHDAEVRIEPSGKPIMVVSGRAKALMEGMGAKAALLSISHSGSLAVSQVVLV